MMAVQCRRLAPAIAFLLLAVSCGQLPLPPGGQPSVAPPSLMASQPPTSSSPATVVPRASGTFAFPLLPSLTPTSLPVSTSTSTPLPPLPGFERALTFGGGGGCGRCGLGYCLANQNPAIRPSVFGTSINEWNEPSERTGYLCLWGIKPQLPFTVRLISPDGGTVLSSDFVYDAGRLSWDGVRGTLDLHESDDGLVNAELPILWPVGAPTGTWQISAAGGGLQVQGVLDATRLVGDEVNRVQEVGIADPSLASRIVPANHEFTPNPATGGLNVTGRGFTPATLAYVLTYQKTERTSGSGGFTNVWDLRNARSVVADDRGTISTEIPGPFYTGQTYMVVSVSDPARLKALDAPWTFNFNDDTIGYESFQIASPARQPATSCRGAPPQRMVAGGQGHVCTQSDAVRLRVAPSRSAGTIVQLPPPTLFTVLAGPSCADNWSWWQIQTGDGTVGWIAEGGDATDPYFICPGP